MAAKLGADPDELVGELVRAIAQDLADGKSIEKVTEGLTKGGLSREQAAKLVDVVVQARNRHENSAEGRAQKRSHAASRMLQGALWGGGGAMVTLLSMGSGGGRVFFGAVIYGGYLFISGLVLWGGNTAQLGDDEELKGGPAWLREVRVGDKVRDAPTGAPAPPAARPVPIRVATPAPAPAPAPPRMPPRPVATTPATSRIPPRPIATTPATPRVAPRIEDGTTITRLYAIAFLWDQIFGLGLPFGIFGRIGLGSLIPALTVLSIMTFVAAVGCAIHVVKDNVEYKFLVLPAYHVIGVLLMFQVMNPVLVEKLSLAHSAVGLIGGIAWIYYTGQFRKAVKAKPSPARPLAQRPVLPRPTPKAAPRP